MSRSLTFRENWWKATKARETIYAEAAESAEDTETL